MPATFAHCLIASRAIDALTRKKPPSPYAAILAQKNNFVVMGAAGPDYPYLTDILTTGVLQIGHTWANRMHYESTALFAIEGVKQLASMDKRGESFKIRLAWFCGYMSHVIADAYAHPVINSIVHGPYMFTHKLHSACELIQDIYIFQKEKGEDIIISNPRGGNFGYLKILDECSDPKDLDRIHPEIRDFWAELLLAAHPNAKEYFNGIDPDKWHYNYKGRVNFVVDSGAIFRHVFGMAGYTYKKAADITPEERKLYIENVVLPSGQTDHYDNIFKDIIRRVGKVWEKLYEDITNTTPANVAAYIKDWNLDTGVDESIIYLWQKKGET